MINKHAVATSLEDTLEDITTHPWNWSDADDITFNAIVCRFLMSKGAIGQCRAEWL